MKRIAKCPVCGTIFTAGRSTQKYCSVFCRKYARRYDLVEHGPASKTAIVLRQFYCVRCGKLVCVTEKSDKRIKFCSSRCERLYWKHSKNVHPLAVYRSFYCQYCGTLVTVTAAKDKRTSFCSAACRKKWFSLHGRKTLHKTNKEEYV